MSSLADYMQLRLILLFFIFFGTIYHSAEARVTRSKTISSSSKQGVEAPPASENLSAAPTNAKVKQKPAAFTTSEIRKDGIHDPSNAGIAYLQNPAEAMSQFPLDQRGQVNWMMALSQGLIKPRANRTGDAKMEPLDLDIIMTDTKTMPHVRFPHLAHTQWLDCSNCHPEIFFPKTGGNPIRMDDVFRGRYCGACHGRVAFSAYTCQRCHSVIHKDSPQQWWSDK
ncbi:MAG: hypothetical protein H7832_01910 [Magnetococcus sp. DMHC-6]